MTSASDARTTPSTYRIDLPACEQAGFATPPFDVHLKVLPAPDGSGWTLLAHSAPGKPDVLARWLARQAALTDVRIAAGLAPRLFRAAMPVLPPVWAEVASFVKVHHLDLAADGQAAWFVAGTRDEVWAVAQHFQERTATPGTRQKQVRYRPVDGRSGAAVSRRQFQALATAVAMGYYEIPHRIDLRALAAASGVSLGSVSELLRRAEGAILTHYVDTNQMGWPLGDDEPGAFRALAERAALVTRPWDPSVRLVPQRFEPATTTPRGKPRRGPPR